jgi:hypothetical protein
MTTMGGLINEKCNARMRQSASCRVHCAAETRSFSTRLQIPAQYGFCQFPDSLGRIKKHLGTAFESGLQLFSSAMGNS